MAVNNTVLEPVDRRLTKHGNSVAIVVPKHIRELFGWNDKQSLKVPFHLFEKKEEK
ncbi:hypothetical protein GQ473_05645 [archaeon]|nr:hypothetical protein [archaeon]